MRLEELLEFAHDNINLRSISLAREFTSNDEKYTVSFNLGLENNFSYYDFLISISKLNKTILVASNNKSETIKDSFLVDKWVSKFESLLNKDIDSRIENVINDAFGRCKTQDILRELKLKKLLE